MSEVATSWISEVATSWILEYMCMYRSALVIVDVSPRGQASKQASKKAKQSKQAMVSMFMHVTKKMSVAAAIKPKLGKMPTRATPSKDRIVRGSAEARARGSRRRARTASLPDTIDRGRRLLAAREAPNPLSIGFRTRWAVLEPVLPVTFVGLFFQILGESCENERLCATSRFTAGVASGTCFPRFVDGLADT